MKKYFLGVIMDYVSKIFPHIKDPTNNLKEIARIIYELLTYGEIISQLEIPIKDLFGTLKNASKNAKKRVISQIRHRINSIIQYNITNEEAIMRMLSYPYPELEPKIDVNQIPLIRLLSKDPIMPIYKITEKLGRSQYWVSKNIKYLRDAHIIGFHGQVDVTAIGLRPIIFLLYVRKSHVKIFKRILNCPYLVNLSEMELVTLTADYIPFYLCFYLPDQPRPKKLFNNWLRFLFHKSIIKRKFFKIELEGSISTLNIDMFDGTNWIFNLRKDLLLQFYFTQKYQDVLPPIDNQLFLYSFKKIKNLTALDLYIISFLELNFRIKKVEILERLRKLGFNYSMTTVLDSYSKVIKHMKPILYLWRGLKDSFYIFIELNSLNATNELNFLLKYFHNALPLSFQFFGENGLFVTASVPPSMSRELHSIAKFLHNYYPDMDIFWEVRIHGRKLISSLIPYWDERKKYWIVEDWMFEIEEDNDEIKERVV